LLIADFRLTIGKGRLPIDDFRLPIDECRLAMFDRGLSVLSSHKKQLLRTGGSAHPFVSIGNRQLTIGN
jgi:hypothetical protein